VDSNDPNPERLCRECGRPTKGSSAILFCWDCAPFRFILCLFPHLTP
jgi:hypothetical protein